MRSARLVITLGTTTYEPNKRLDRRYADYLVTGDLQHTRWLSQRASMNLNPHVHDMAIWISALLKAHLSVSGVAFALVLASTIWVIAGRRLRGIRLLTWLLVPVLLTVASIAVAGPGRLFSKDGHEGAMVLVLSRKNAITMLDLFGLLCFALAIALVLTLVIVQRRQGRTTCLSRSIQSHRVAKVDLNTE